MKTAKLVICILGVGAAAACGSSTNAPTPGAPAPGTPAAAPTGSLPISGTGVMLASALPGTVTGSTSSFSGLPQVSTDATGVVASDQSAASGMEITISGSPDDNPAEFQAGGPTQAALISVSVPGTMTGGTGIPGFTDAKGNVYFENGNFGDPQAESATGALSTVGVYNPPSGDQIVLSDLTTVRYRGATTNTGEVVYGVGFVGNPTPNMPTGEVLTYRAFWENGATIYDDGGTVRNMFLQGDASLVADTSAGTVTGGVANARLAAADPTTGAVTNLNPNVTDLAVDGMITGNTFAGTAILQDASGAAVGTQTSRMIGGFFGDGASEAAAAIENSGTMELGGTTSGYFLQGVIGGTQ